VQEMELSPNSHIVFVSDLGGCPIMVLSHCQQFNYNGSSGRAPRAIQYILVSGALVYHFPSHRDRSPNASQISPSALCVVDRISGWPEHRHCLPAYVAPAPQNETLDVVGIAEALGKHVGGSLR
jgi:hypothetical protein